MLLCELSPVLVASPQFVLRWLLLVWVFLWEHVVFSSLSVTCVPVSLNTACIRPDASVSNPTVSLDPNAPTFTPGTKIESDGIGGQNLSSSNISKKVWFSKFVRWTSEFKQTAVSGTWCIFRWSYDLSWLESCILHAYWTKAITTPWTDQLFKEMSFWEVIEGYRLLPFCLAFDEATRALKKRYGDLFLIADASDFVSAYKISSECRRKFQTGLNLKAEGNLCLLNFPIKRSQNNVRWESINQFKGPVPWVPVLNVLTIVSCFDETSLWQKGLWL